MDETILNHQQVQTNGIELHCVSAGKGPLVLLLHGFPDFWHSYRNQIEPLSRSFHVVAPDMRGYNLSSKPAGIASYGISHLVKDMEQLIPTLGHDQAHIVAHDWGGAVAWWLAMRHPERVDRLAVLNSPHPVAFYRELKTWKQLKKSWYMLFFQVPELPEVMLRAGNFKNLRKAIRSAFIRREQITDQDLDLMVEALSQPGALTAALNYYRAAARGSDSAVRMKPTPIDCPTLLLWGEDDHALGVPLTLGLEKWITNLEVQLIASAGHWVHQEAPEEVNEALLAHLQA